MRTVQSRHFKANQRIAYPKSCFVSDGLRATELVNASRGMGEHVVPWTGHAWEHRRGMNGACLSTMGGWFVHAKVYRLSGTTWVQRDQLAS
jgi:hypothetical protein